MKEKEIKNGILAGTSDYEFPFERRSEEEGFKCPLGANGRPHSTQYGNHGFVERYKAGESICGMAFYPGHYVQPLPVFKEDFDSFEMNGRNYYKIRVYCAGNSSITKPIPRGSALYTLDMGRGCWYDGFAYITYGADTRSYSVQSSTGKDPEYSNWMAIAKVGDLLDYAEKHGIPTVLEGDRDEFVVVGASACMTTPAASLNSFRQRFPTQYGNGYGHFYSPHVTPQLPQVYFGKMQTLHNPSANLMRQRKIVNYDDIPMAELLKMKKKEQ